jgi:hypothetical protein
LAASDPTKTTNNLELRELPEMKSVSLKKAIHDSGSKKPNKSVI